VITLELFPVTLIAPDPPHALPPVLTANDSADPS
jgi:hypothetical protein